MNYTLVMVGPYDTAAEEASRRFGVTVTQEVESCSSR